MSTESTETSAAAVEAVVVAWLCDELRIDASELARDAKLVRTGLLDSAGLVQLATHLERKFGIQIPDRYIDADHLDSVAMIVDTVQRLMRT